MINESKDWDIEYDASIRAINIKNSISASGLFLDLSLRATPGDLLALAVMFRKAYQDESSRTGADAR